MKTNRFLPFLLAFALLFTQQGAAIHALSHWQEAPHSTAHSDSERATHGSKNIADHLCASCLAFSALAAALPSAKTIFAIRHDFHAHFQRQVFGFTSPFLAAYLSRAPPSSLV